MSLSGILSVLSIKKGTNKSRRKKSGGDHNTSSSDGEDASPEGSGAVTGNKPNKERKGLFGSSSAGKQKEKQESTAAAAGSSSGAPLDDRIPWGKKPGKGDGKDGGPKKGKKGAGYA
jgi:hypothetical protein